jgi:hypothetical protein
MQGFQRDATRERPPSRISPEEGKTRPHAWDPAGASMGTTQAISRGSPASSASVESPLTSHLGSDRMTRPEFATLTIELETLRSSDRPMQQSSRAIVFLNSDRPDRQRGVIAFDGEHSRAGVGRRDRFATEAHAGGAERWRSLPRDRKRALSVGSRTHACRRRPTPFPTSAASVIPIRRETPKQLPASGAGLASDHLRRTWPERGRSAAKME